MVNAFGYYASAKGMVLVPNLSGLTRTAAISAIQAANLVYVDGGSITTSNPALNDFVASQLPNANDLVDYGTNVSFIYYNYVPITTTTTGGPTQPPTTTTTTSGPTSPPGTTTTTTTTTTVAPPTTTTTTTTGPTTYWYTGCCSTTGIQVTGTSNVSFADAFNQMNSQCSGTVTNQQSGVGGTIPVLSCTPPTTTTTTTTTTTAGPTTTTTTLAPSSSITVAVTSTTTTSITVGGNYSLTGATSGNETADLVVEVVGSTAFGFGGTVNPGTSGPWTATITGLASGTTYTLNAILGGTDIGTVYATATTTGTTNSSGITTTTTTAAPTSPPTTAAPTSAPTTSGPTSPPATTTTTTTTTTGGIQTCNGVPEPYPGECFCQAGVWLC